MAEPRLATPTPTWEQGRAAVLAAICGLRELGEALSERLTEMQKGPWHSVYCAMKQWGDEECARIEEESLEQKRLQKEDDT